MASAETVGLPTPRYGGRTSVEQAILSRRSVRRFSPEPLTPEEISQLLWAAQGVTSPGGLRAAPSAGALYPLEAYALLGHAAGLGAGVWRYRLAAHDLERRSAGDPRPELCRAAFGQHAVGSAPGLILLTGFYERVTRKYGPRGVRYVDMEAGHAAQNICLQAVALGLESVVIGAFHDAGVKEVAGLAAGEEPLYLIPVGR